MKKQVLFIHCGGSQGPHEGSNDLVAYLRNSLGSGYKVLYPKMPDPDHPEYLLWKSRLVKQLDRLQDDVILIGHSLGGSVLLKYLSEESCPKSIAGLFIVAAPYWGMENWEVDEYALRQDFFSHLPRIPQIFLYHSLNDEVVPFEHLLFYASKLPNSTIRKANIGMHLFSTGLPELVTDIRNLAPAKQATNGKRGVRVRARMSNRGNKQQ